MGCIDRGEENQTMLSGLSEKDVDAALVRLVNQQTVGKI